MDEIVQRYIRGGLSPEAIDELGAELVAAGLQNVVTDALVQFGTAPRDAQAQ